MKAKRIALINLKLDLHPESRAAFDRWSAVPPMMDLTNLPIAILQAMIMRLSLVALDGSPVKKSLIVVAGFQAMRLISALELREARPSHVLVTFIPAKRDMIRLAIQSELCERLIPYPGQSAGSAIAHIAKGLSPEIAVALFGKEKVDRRTLARVSSLHPKLLTTQKPIASDVDSSILSSILMKR